MTGTKDSLPAEVANLPGRSMLILYGTETGNSQDVAEDLGRMAQRLHFQIRVEDMETAKLNRLLEYTLVIIVISTTGQGDIPVPALGFWKSLLRKKLPPDCLSSVRYTTFGLGDSSYPKFNWAVRKLHKRISQLGATEFHPRGEGDEQDDDGIDEIYIRWSTDLRNKLLENFPLPEDISPIAHEALLPPRWKLTIDVNQKGSASANDIHGNEVESGDGPTVSDPSKASGSKAASVGTANTENTELDHGISHELLHSVPDSVAAVLQHNERVTPSNHWQDVRSLKFDIYESNANPPEFKPGDCLKLFPRNFQADVTRLIELMGWEDLADVDIDTSTLGIRPTGLHTRRFTTLRRLLTENLDITAVPRRSFLEAIAHHCEDQFQKDRLVEFTKSEFIDEYYDYATRSRRSILEVLEEFHTVKIPAEYVLDVFPIIRGRDFSIAGIEHHHHRLNHHHPQLSTPTASSSTPSTNSSSAIGPTHTIELLVALVKYQTVLRKIRTGLFSRYIAPLTPGTPVLASHKRSLTNLHGPGHARRPLCALSTGTGIAPVRALIQERLGYDSPDTPTGRTVLFFGNRSREKDFFYRDEWEAIGNEKEEEEEQEEEKQKKEKKLEVYTAFSRDQRQKIYIQDAIRQQVSEVVEMVKGNAIFIVCGGSSKMATACRVAVTDCILKGGLCETQEEADKCFEKLTWWQEIW